MTVPSRLCLRLELSSSGLNQVRSFPLCSWFVVGLGALLFFCDSTWLLTNGASRLSWSMRTAAAVSPRLQRALMLLDTWVHVSG